MIDYIIFFGIFFISIVIFCKWNPPETKYDPVVKCESPIERRLYYALIREGYIVVPQVRCGKYRIDLAIPSLNLAIECDGKAYHSTTRQKAHDYKKNAYLRKHGWRVLRFTGSQINGKLSYVITKIRNITKTP